MSNLSYIKINGETIFGATSTLCNEMVEICLGVRVEKRLVKTLQFPKYNSWAGFNGWQETIVKELGLSNVQAYIALLNPTEDYDWVLSTPDWLLEQLCRAVTPFNKEQIVPEAVTYWLQYGAEKLCSFRDMLTHSVLLTECRPVNSAEFRKARYLVCGNWWYGPLAVHKFPLWREIKGMQRSPEELCCFGLYGVISPKRVELITRMVYNSHRPGDRRLLLNWVPSESEKSLLDKIEEINPLYFDGEQSLKAVRRLGMKFEVPGLTKKESARFIEENSDSSWMSVNNTQKILNWYSESVLDIPEAWIWEIRSFEVARWAARHLNQLSKSRIIYGPGGVQQTMHYHQLLREVAPEMLVNGPKTAWRSVMEALEQRAADRIKADLGENVALPQIKHAPVIGTTPIKTSYALRDEGELMSHCVGGYVRACLSGRSYIYHIGKMAPAGVTVEVIPSDNDFKVTQVFGYKDRVATEAEWQMANKLLAVINKK